MVSAVGGAEILDTNQWLKTTLSANASLASLTNGEIWYSKLPESHKPPAVIYRHLSGDDTQGVSTTRILSPLDYLIEGIVLGDDYTTLRALSAGIDAALQGAAGETANLVIYAVARQSPFSDDEQAPGGDFYHRAGGVYRITVRPTYA